MTFPDLLPRELLNSPRLLQQSPHDRRSKRYRSHPSNLTREDNLRIGCLTVGTIDVLESNIRSVRTIIGRDLRHVLRVCKRDIDTLYPGTVSCRF